MYYVNRYSLLIDNVYKNAIIFPVYVFSDICTYIKHCTVKVLKVPNFTAYTFQIIKIK